MIRTPFNVATVQVGVASLHKYRADGETGEPSEQPEQFKRTNDMNEQKFYIIRYADNGERRIIERFSTTADVMNDDTERLQAFCVFGYDFDSYEIEPADENDSNEFENIDEFLDLY